MFFKNAFKEDFLAKTVVYISSLETLPEKLQSLGEKQYTTLEARFIANILSLSVLEIWPALLLMFEADTAHTTDRIECECWYFRKEPERDVYRSQGSLTNINNNMSFSYRVLSSGRTRRADLLSIQSDTFAYPNPSHKPTSIHEFIRRRGEWGEEPDTIKVKIMGHSWILIILFKK